MTARFDGVAMTAHRLRVRQGVGVTRAGELRSLDDVIDSFGGDGAARQAQLAAVAVALKDAPAQGQPIRIIPRGPGARGRCGRRPRLAVPLLLVGGAVCRPYDQFVAFGAGAELRGAAGHGYPPS